VVLTRLLLLLSLSVFPSGKANVERLEKRKRGHFEKLLLRVRKSFIIFIKIIKNKTHKKSLFKTCKLDKKQKPGELSLVFRDH